MGCCNKPSHCGGGGGGGGGGDDDDDDDDDDEEEEKGEEEKDVEENELSLTRETNILANTVSTYLRCL